MSYFDQHVNLHHFGPAWYLTLVLHHCLGTPPGANDLFSLWLFWQVGAAVDTQWWLFYSLFFFFFTYTPQIHWVVDIQVITIISVSVFLTASHTLGPTSTDWDRWLHQYCALKSVLSWQMGCKWWFKLGNICTSLRIIVFTKKPETTPEPSR